MEVQQIYELVNNATAEAVGASDLLAEDLSNIVEVGKQIENARGIDNFVRSLTDHIGRMIFVNRPYSASVPSVLRDGWEYGSIMQKVASRMPEATENESWQLNDSEHPDRSYDPNKFYPSDVFSLFYNNKTTWEIPLSIAEMQVKSAFNTAGQMNGFLSMLTTGVDNSATIKLDEIVMRTINNFTAKTFVDAFPSGTYTGAGNRRCVNLLPRYNTRYSKSLTAEQAVTDPDFAKFAAYTMRVTMRRMNKMSVHFNIGGEKRFTPKDKLHVVMLADFLEATSIYLQSDTFHNELVKLPEAETVAYWQGTGDDYGFESITGINVKAAGMESAINPTGILAVMFDHEALGVLNPQRRVTTNYNPKAEFFNNWYKFESQYFNDLNENFVVFYVA